MMEAVTEFLIQFPGIMNPVTAPACGSGQNCEYMVEVPSSVCFSPSDISVVASAANRLGVGPSNSNDTIIGINIVTLCLSDLTFVSSLSQNA